MTLTQDPVLRKALRIVESTVFIPDTWGGKHEVPYLEFVTDDRSPKEIDYVIARLEREEVRIDAEIAKQTRRYRRWGVVLWVLRKINTRWGQAAICILTMGTSAW